MKSVKPKDDRQPSFQIHREVVGSIPATLSRGKALALSNNRVLIVDGESCFYDLPSHQVFQRDQYRLGPFPPHSLSIMRDRYLLAEDNGGFTCLDTLAKQSRFLPRSSSRVGASAVVPRQEGFYVIGGKDLTNNSLKNTFEYMPWAHATSLGSRDMGWEDRPSIQIPRHSAQAIAIGTNLYLVGGYFWNRENCRYEACPRVEIFDGQNWRLGPELHHPRERPCLVVLNERIIVVLGGTCNGQTVEEVEVWDTETNGFVVWGTVELPRTDFSAIAWRGDVYLFCGNNSSVERLKFNLSEFDREAMETAILFDTRPARQPVLAEASGAHRRIIVKPSTPGLELPTKYIPTPPIRPVLPRTNTTLFERYEALQQYDMRVDRLNEEYRQTLEATNRRINLAYNRARDRALEEVQEQGRLWLDESARLAANARHEVANLEPLIQGERLFSEQFIEMSSSDQDSYEDDVPSALRCPITLNLMKDPVVAADGNTYERYALEQWLVQNNTSPLTGAPMPSKTFHPIHTLKIVCQHFAASLSKSCNTHTTTHNEKSMSDWDDDGDDVPHFRDDSNMTGTSPRSTTMGPMY